MKLSIRGAFFILANIISAIAVVIPYYIFSIKGHSTQTASMSLLYNGDMWYWYGILLLVADVAAIVMTLIGFKKPLAIVALANVATSIYAVIYTNLSKIGTEASMRVVFKFTGELTGSKTDMVVKNGPGFYLIILAMILILITGLWAAFERD
ncbi:MAG: hypothetical protein J6X33_09360 [Clostridiales bacterium]|nr:hypothetical protein [Clostridiales bacterium]